MAASTGYSYPPTIDEAESSRLVQVIKDWTVGNGLTVRPPPSVTPADTGPQGILGTSAPVTLFPSFFPEACFSQAKLVQKTYNELYAKISQDEEFLAQIVKE